MQGTYRPYRDREEADFPPVTDTEPPDWLIGPEAVAEWHHLLAHLMAANIVTVADLTQLACYCNMLARVIMKWRAGGEPSAAELTQLRLMAGEFGLTPATRSRPLKVAGGGVEKPLQSIREGSTETTQRRRRHLHAGSGAQSVGIGGDG